MKKSRFSEEQIVGVLAPTPGSTEAFRKLFSSQMR